jgi:hypothetical protein
MLSGGRNGVALDERTVGSHGRHWAWAKGLEVGSARAARSTEMARGARAVERIDADAFKGDRLRRPGDWLVAFVADWCPFCREFVGRFASTDWGTHFQPLQGDVTDEESPLWETFHLEVVPTIVAFRDGVSVYRRDGRLGYGLEAADVAAIRAALAKL